MRMGIGDPKIGGSSVGLQSVPQSVEIETPAVPKKNHRRHRKKQTHLQMQTLRQKRVQALQKYQK